jgi:hypothetical protein
MLVTSIKEKKPTTQTQIQRANGESLLMRKSLKGIKQAWIFPGLRIRALQT